MTVATIWRFRTENFTAIVDCDYERDPDLSWDETGEVADKIERGEWGNYCFRARILGPRGEELAADYLGNSIHARPADFRHGGYFADMIREVVAEARHALRCAQSIRIRAA
jgi:hypothetical protein